VAHKRPDVALQHDAFNPIPGVRVPFYRVGLRGLALDLSLVSSASVDANGSAPRSRPDALKHWHAEKMRKHGLWCSRQLWAFAPLVVSGVPHADSLRLLELLATQTVQAIVAQRAGMDVDGAGTVAVMGASTPQMRGAVLGRLKAEFSLVAMKAGCLRAFEALRCGGGAAVPPAPAAALPGVGAALAPPSPVVGGLSTVARVCVYQAKQTKRPFLPYLFTCSLAHLLTCSLADPLTCSLVFTRARSTRPRSRSHSLPHHASLPGSP